MFSKSDGLISPDLLSNGIDANKSPLPINWTFIVNPPSASDVDVKFFIIPRKPS